MQEEIVKYETAFLAMEKKFDEFVYDSYIIDTQQRNSYRQLEDWNETLDHVSAPLQSKLQKWIRKNHGYHPVIIPTVTSAWTYKIVKVISKQDDDYILGLKSVSELPPYTEVCAYDFKTYEDALEDALFESLKMIP